MQQLNLRFSDSKVYENLKKQAQEKQISINKLAIQAIEQFLQPSNSNITQAVLDQRLAPLERELAELRQAIKPVKKR
jgi:polyhydroxyalkanoate synthesis regulator phasin